MRIYLESLGCRLNQSEVETIAREFVARGAGVVASVDDAEVCVINTCAVTAAAERKSHRRIELLARDNPYLVIAAIGCYATLSPKQCSDLPAVKWVLPNAEKSRTVDVILQARDRDVHAAAGTGTSPDNCASECSPCVELPPPRRSRTRAFIKVQDGCDNTCTYCIVRRLRGAARSRPLNEIVDEVNTLVSDGCKEVVLCGVNLGSYGRDRDLDTGLATLARTLLCDTDLPRLRLSSIEPWDIDESFFELWEERRMCRHVHLPLQAGHDTTLRRMGRRITLSEYTRLVAAARAAAPGMAVTTDVIVGFPGEDEPAFRSSCEFVAAIAFARVHVFPYSGRPGTPANLLPEQVPAPVIRSRAVAMRELASVGAEAFKKQFIGVEVTVLWENSRSPGRYSGLTDNYLRVVTASSEELHNQLTSVRVVGLKDGMLVGEPG